MGLFRKSGGGKLNNVDGTISTLTFTTKPFGEKTSDKFGDAMYAVLEITPDGSDEAVFTPLKIGDADGYEVDADRPYWLSTDKADIIHPSSQFGKLLGSMVEAGMSSESIVESDDAQEADFTVLVGGRFHFLYKDDVELQAKFGKKKVKTKDGKNIEVDRRFLAVSAVYALGEGGVVAAPTGKTSAKKETPASVTDDTVAAILKESPGRKIQRSKLAAKLALKLGKSHPMAKAAQELVNDDDWLTGAHKGFTYNDDMQEFKAA